MQRDQLFPRRLLFYFLFLLVFYALQSSLFGAWSLRGYHIDLLPCFIAAAALLGGPMEGFAVGAMVGLFYDVGYIGPEGIYPLLMGGLGLLAGVFAQPILSGGYTAMVILNAVLGILIGLVRFLSYLMQNGASFGLVMQQTIGGTVLSCLLCFLVYRPMERISKMVQD